MQLDIQELEELSKTLYVRALKLLPRDIKAGFAELQARETDATGRTVLATMVENIAVAEGTNDLLSGHRHSDLQRHHWPQSQLRRRRATSSSMFVALRRGGIGCPCARPVLIGQ